MNASSPRDSSPDTTLVELFEQAWLDRPPADLEAHLPGAGDPARTAVLIDLVHIDLEYRWKSGAGRLVEEYLQQYPELTADPTTVLDLIAWEYELRRRSDPTLTPEDYLQRFPGQAGPLTSRLGKDRTESDAEGPDIPGYQILGELGRGGMGVVYRARQVALDRIVALKVIRAELSPHPLARARFQTEARAIARLDHPGIVRVHDSGMYHGQPYFVLEHVAGGSLAQRLRAGPLPPRQAAALVAHLADAVQHAHDAGLVHRDLKPANVLLAGEPGDSGNRQPRDAAATPLAHLVPRIADFGLARNLTAGALTLPGDFIGTPGYMAPEQARGEDERIGPSVDVFGLGAILYECLTGRPPYQGSSREEVLTQARAGNVLPPRRVQPGVPASLERICLRALACDPGRRPASAAALAAELRGYLRRRWRVVKGAVVLGLVGVLALLWVLWPPSPTGGSVPVQEVPPAPVRIREVAFLGTTKEQTRWVNVLRDPAQVLPLRNGELIRVRVTLDEPGYVYLIYLDDEGSPIPLYPWNDRTLKILDVSVPPPVRPALRQIESPPRPHGWRLEGKTSFDGVLILARATPLPARVRLGTILGKMKLPIPPEPDRLIARSSPEIPGLLFDHARGHLSDLRGQLDDPRGLQKVAQPIKDDLFRELGPLYPLFESIVAFRFMHQGN